MKSRFLGALVAVAAAFAVAVAVIWVATGPDASPPRQLPPPPQDAGTPAPGGLIDPSKVPLSILPPVDYVIVKDAPPPPPPRGSWEAVPIIASRRGGAVIRFDEEARAKLSECFTPAIASRYAGTKVAEAKDFAPLVDASTTLLLLQVEVVRDEALVVDAPVESRGTASDGTIACAQAVLRNRTAPAGGLPTGKHRIRFLLAQ